MKKLLHDALSHRTQFLLVFAGVLLVGGPIKSVEAGDSVHLLRRHHAGQGELTVSSSHQLAATSQNSTEKKAPGEDDPDVIPRQIAKWTGQSSVPGFVQFLLATVWIGLMGILPLILPLIEREPLTKTQITVGACMLATVFGGFLLFTNVILFQSVHFDRVRPLTTVECIYLMAQIITTVGYGDVGPAKPRGQLFVGLYVLGALFIVAMLVSDVVSHVVKSVDHYKAQAAEKWEVHVRRPRGWSQEDVPPDTMRRRQESLNSLLSVPKPDLWPLMNSLLWFLFFDVTWILFFRFYPGEDKTWASATYMSVITLSTVGFGFVTPITEGGMVFGAFWMILGSAALVNVISNFSSLVFELKEYERMCKADLATKSMSLLEGGLQENQEEVTEAQFLRFGLLRRGLVSEEDIKSILEAFQALGPEGGKVHKNTVKDTLEEVHSPAKGRSIGSTTPPFQTARAESES